jgi:hypothetical protein
MPVKKQGQTLGLILATVGGFGSALGLIWLVGGAIEWSDGAVGRGSFTVGCSIFTLALSFFLLWRGIVMRRKAMRSKLEDDLDPDAILGSQDDRI